MLDDEQLVGPLEELVHRRAHRALDDVDEPLGVDAPVGAHEQRAAPALIVRRQRHQLEDALDVAVVEARLQQPVGCRPAHQPLRTWARVDARRLDADHTTHALARRGGDPDQLRDLLRRQAGDRGAPFDRVLRLDPDFGPERALPFDHLRRDVSGERLDEERLADHDLVHGFPEQLRETAHVHTLLRRIEIDGARDLGRERLLAPGVLDADRLGYLGHADALQAELHLGHRGLQVDGRIAAGGRHWI